MDSLFRAGDRLELISVPNDPRPVASGTLGTVIMDSTDLHNGQWQTAMMWDNGRTLAIISPIDKVKVISSAEDHLPVDSLSTSDIT